MRTNQNTDPSFARLARATISVACTAIEAVGLGVHTLVVALRLALRTSHLTHTTNADFSGAACFSTRVTVGPVVLGVYTLVVAFDERW